MGRNLKKGYHYTSRKNWEQIQKDGGMRKYLINKEELRPYFPSGVRGVWLWASEPTGVSHAGNIMYQIGSKGIPDVVKLEISYNPRRLVRYNRMEIELHHDGKVENWTYHYADRAVIVKEDIPLQQIRIIGSYNTVQLLGT